MFEVQYQDHTLKVKFHRERDTHRDGSDKVITHCRITVVDTEYEYNGCARQNHRDKYVKLVGRKIALARAIVEMKANSPRIFALYGKRNVARRIWQSFHEKYTGVKVLV